VAAGGVAFLGSFCIVLAAALPGHGAQMPGQQHEESQDDDRDEETSGVDGRFGGRYGQVFIGGDGFAARAA